ncbi:hypothetical protein BB560_002342 [Smittium megazygosporum]|uniref:ATP synthase subunit delta, mitochondrial n=1 Tax=Smittium megazygosporum TaxID=133381 RepID=A0A2T9ZF40_9FUNG|nr:hypothetical protein BB560_002342 [Smittium megazygosporum]
MFRFAKTVSSRILPTLSSKGLRAYASEAAAKGKGLIVNFSVPHQSILKSAPAIQVNASAVSGDMGILPDHVPSIEQLKPGMLEIVQETGAEKWFVTGGFAIITPESVLNINAVEAYKLADISPEAVKRELADSKQFLAAAKNDQEKAAAEIEIELYETLQQCLLSTQ